MRFGNVLAMVVLLAGLALTGLLGCNAVAPVPNIDATVAAKVQATLVAAPTQTPLPTYTPYPTATPAATYTPYPTPNSVARATPFPAAAQSHHRPAPIPANETSVDTDRAALAAFYHAAGGPDWINNRNWLSDEPLGTWNGVSTNAAGRVTALSLIENNLDGSIPRELGNLSNLEALILVDNQLSGSIPPELGQLSNLEGLGLSSNQLTGTIPPQLGKLSNLEGLGLGSNQLTGTIPPELGNLFALEFLWLYGNQLTGSIPPELGKLSGLKVLALQDNQLTGAIPPELGNLSNLKDLRLHNNRLTGELPLSLMRTDLDGLLYADNAGLCMPWSPSMQVWRERLSRVERTTCPRR